MSFRNSWLAAWPLLIVAAVASYGQTSTRPQQFDPVQWSLAFQPAAAAPGDRVLGRLTAKIEPGWRLYAPTTPKPSIPTQLDLTESDFVTGWEFYQPDPVQKYDPNFEIESQIYQDQAVFLVGLELSKDAPLGAQGLEAKVRYSACNDRLCLPPVRKTASATLTIAAQSSSAAPAVPGGYSEAPRASVAPPSGNKVSKAAPPAAPPSPADQGLLPFAGLAFGFGLLAIFTPCVFPMIPITMSYFVSTQTGSRQASLAQAITFCLGVIVLFTGIGAAVAAVLGPFGLTQLGSSVWVNLFIALIFVVFAASLMGAFEITVPSSALTSLNKVSGRGGLLGTLVMGLVFALASFACTGPFLGVLLAGSLQGDLTWPIFGMLMFSAGLALPFFFLALFPSYLSKLPKSGGWMVRVKVTMGFLVLAASVKYLSNVDQVYQWWILTRERFLAIWIVLLALAGFYLLGRLRIGDAGGESAGESIGLGRLALGGLFLILAVSLIPGMFGGRLGELDAYVPPPEYSGLPLAGGVAGAASSQNRWLKDDYQQALALAQQTGKPILLSFTGYACSNCHWMKANMFTKPEIAETLDDLVLLELYTDGTDQASEVNQQMQLEKFGTVAIPFYAIIRPDESVVAQFPGRTRNTGEFRAFLSSAGAQLAVHGASPSPPFDHSKP